MGANEYHKKGNLVDSELGKKNTDSKGSPVCAAHMDPSKAYAEIPQLLQKVINDDDPEAWAAIVEKIDYIYAHIDHSLI